MFSKKTNTRIFFRNKTVFQKISLSTKEMSHIQPKPDDSPWSMCPICYDIIKISDKNDKETLRKHLRKHTLSLEEKKQQLNAVESTSHDNKCNPNKIQSEQDLQKDNSTSKFQPPRQVLICPLCEEEIDNTDQEEAVIIYKHLKKRHPIGMKDDILKEMGTNTKAINKCEYCDQIFDVTPLIQYHVQKFHPNVEQVKQLLEDDENLEIKQTRRFSSLSTIVEEEEDILSSSTEYMSCHSTRSVPLSETKINNFDKPVTNMIETQTKKKYSSDKVMAIRTDTTQQSILLNVGIEQLAVCPQHVFDAIIANHKKVLTMQLTKIHCTGDHLLSVIQHVEKMTLCGIGQSKFQNTIGQINPKKTKFETADDTLASKSSKLQRKK